VLLGASLHRRSVDEIAGALSRRKLPFAFVTGQNSDALPKGFQDAPSLANPCRAEQIVEALADVIVKAAGDAAQGGADRTAPVF
jgi:hypothetical protein